VYRLLSAKGVSGQNRGKLSKGVAVGHTRWLGHLLSNFYDHSMAVQVVQYDSIWIIVLLFYIFRYPRASMKAIVVIDNNPAK
jgi:hypothetical protein